MKLHKIISNNIANSNKPTKIELILLNLLWLNNALSLKAIILNMKYEIKIKLISVLLLLKISKLKIS